MYRNIIFFILITTLVTCLLAQYDHKQTILNQIRRYEANRDFSKALELYEQLVESHPQDYSFIGSYIRALLLTSQPDTASDLLENYKNVMPAEVYLENQIPILINRGKRQEALEKAYEFFRRHPGRINAYQSVISVFERERMPDFAIKIGLLARKNSNNDHLYTLEMARNYQNINNYKLAVEEYLKHLVRNPNFFNFISNRIKSILDNDEQNIIIVDEQRISLINKSPEHAPRLNELYGILLVHVNRPEEALDIYKELDISKLINFSDELIAAQNLSVAKQALNYYIEAIEEPHLKANAQLTLSKIYISENELNRAKELLYDIYNNENLQDRQNRFRTRANREAREILAEIALRESKPQQKAFEYLEEAKQFSNNRNEQNEIEYLIAFYQIMNQEFLHAENRIKNILVNEPSGSSIFNQSFYYNYLIALMQNETSEADSLLNEIIIRSPEHKNTTNALYLSIISSGLDASSNKTFLEAYRKKNLFKTEEAVNIILQHLEISFNEELAIIAADWLLELNRVEEALEIYMSDFDDDTLKGYSTIMLSQLFYERPEDKNSLITDFLRNYPDHIFATKLRQILMHN